jgi:nitrite reductase/ring-hydroxylating ferredoxin subunit
MQSFDTDPDKSTDDRTTGQTFEVCPIDSLPQGQCRRFILPNDDELAICNVNGEYYAIDNFCPHRGAPLSDGLLTGHVIECGWHGWQFDVRTGECLTVTERIRTYSVGVRDGMVVVEF